MDWKAQAALINLTWTNKANMGRGDRIRFLALAIAGESGELANVVKKQWRDSARWDDAQIRANYEATCAELADVMIYAYVLADLLGVDIDAECERKMLEVEKRPFAQA